MSACPDNTRILSGCFRNVVRVLQESCPDNSGMLSGCCKNNHEGVYKQYYSGLIDLRDPLNQQFYLF